MAMIPNGGLLRLPDTVFLTEGGTGKDISGSGYAETLSNMATAIGKHTQAMDFNGSNGSVSYNNTIIPLGAKTIEVICRFDTVTSETLLDTGGGNTLQHGFLIIIESGKVVLYSSKNVNEVFRFVITSSATLVTSAWYYIAMTWDGTTASNAVKLYINGALDTQGTANATEVTAATNNLNLGRFYSSGLYYGYHDGRIQSIRVGNTVATPAFIQAESKRMGF